VGKDVTGARTVLTVELGVEGMTCASCAARLERVLSKRAGVIRAEVQLVHERARIQVAAGTTIESLVEAVQAAGFTPRRLPKQSVVRTYADDEARFAAVAQRDGWLLLASVVLALPLVLPMVAMPFGVHWHLSPWIEFALATPVQFFLGARFYRAGTKALLHGSGNMDLLVALGTSAAYFFSVWQLVRLDHGALRELYFEASAVIITLVRLGKWLESKARRGTTAALRALLQLQPGTVTVRQPSRGDGSSGNHGLPNANRSNKAQCESQLPIEELEIGMLMVVRPGERFAADGIVVEGRAAADESMITGESLPVERRPGDAIVGGSLNINGLVVAQVSRLGEDATLGKIIQMVYGAQAGKAAVQQLVDRISAWFVPIVLGIGGVTFVGWWLTTARLDAALVAAVSVLVIACPCALGLATPTAIVAGTGAAARLGILVRDVNTLQQASQIDTVVFDKTGTLTEGQPTVVSAEVCEGSVAKMLQLAACIEQASGHPLANAIVQHAKQSGCALFSMPEDFESHAGDGISGTIDGELIRVGRLVWLGQCGVEKALSREQEMRRYGSHAFVGVSRGTILLGTLAIADRPRETAKTAIRELEARGMRTVVLSGDDERVARALADELAIGEAIGRARPEDKLRYVTELVQAGRKVAMIGDGINDAPALAAAHVGIAIGGGTDVALQTANVVIMRPDLRLIAVAFDVARATFGKIRQNLFWAFVYNCVGIPLAAAGRLSPMVAGLAMALSSVSVVTNSLLLRRFRARILAGAVTEAADHG
jgi:P-type Cu+ transporter